LWDYILNTLSNVTVFCAGRMLKYIRCSSQLLVYKMFNPLLHEHIVKDGCFHWKASCYKFKLLRNYQKCFNTDQTWHKCWLDHCRCNIMLNLKFPVTMATGVRLKIANITILRGFFLFFFFFSTKLISKCCNFLMDCDRVKGFSALVTRYLKVDLRLF
jgi:hypothetical protein